MSDVHLENYENILIFVRKERIALNKPKMTYCLEIVYFIHGYTNTLYKAITMIILYKLNF